MDGTTLFLGHFGMGRFCTWAVFVWAVFACGPFWDGPFSFGMTWYLGRLHLKAPGPGQDNLFRGSPKRLAAWPLIYGYVTSQHFRKVNQILTSDKKSHH